MFFSKEWLLNELPNQADNKAREELLILWLTSASDYLIEDCREIAYELFEKSEQNNDKSLRAFSLLYISYYNRLIGDRSMGDQEFKQAEALLNELDPGFASSVVCQMIAFEYWTSGMRDKAFELSYRGLKLAEFVGGEGKGWARFQLGVFYFDMKDYENSLRYFLEVEENSIRNDLPYQLARARSGIGGNYIAIGKIEEAANYNALALEGYRTCGHKTAISRALNDLGVISFRLEDLEAAEKYLREALLIREELKYAPGITTSRMELAKVLIKKGELDKGEEMLKDALELCEKTDSKQKSAQCHNMFYELFKQRKDPWKALEHLEKYFEVRSLVEGEQSSNRIKHLQQKYATEKSDREAEIHRLKNVELKAAYDVIEEKNKSITDSIIYAKRIQDSLLPTMNYIEKTLERLNK